KRNIAREKLKTLLEILQVAISEHRQGIANEEIEEKIEKDMLKLEAMQIFRELVLLDSVPKEIKHCIIDFREKISKLNNDKTLSIDISNAKGELLDKEKITQFVKDLQERLDNCQERMIKTKQNKEKVEENYSETGEKSNNEECPKLKKKSVLKRRSTKDLEMQNMEEISATHSSKVSKDQQAQEEAISSQIQVLPKGND
ncbi:11349_t:CDS:2, partial [Gigaspora margarita]